MNASATSAAIGGRASAGLSSRLSSMPPISEGSPMVPNQEVSEHPGRPLAGGLAAPRAAYGRLGGLIALAAAAALLYYITVSERVTLDSFLPLADGFLHGRLYIDQPMPWLELVPRADGGWYSPFPPMPADRAHAVRGPLRTRIRPGRGDGAIRWCECRPRLVAPPTLGSGGRPGQLAHRRIRRRQRALVGGRHRHRVAVRPGGRRFLLPAGAPPGGSTSLAAPGRPVPRLRGRLAPAGGPHAARSTWRSTCGSRFRRRCAAWGLRTFDPASHCWPGWPFPPSSWPPTTSRDSAPHSSSGTS